MLKVYGCKWKRRMQIWNCRQPMPTGGAPWASTGMNCTPCQLGFCTAERNVFASVTPHQRCRYSDSPFERIPFLYCRVQKGVGGNGYMKGQKGYGSCDRVGCAISRLDYGFRIPSRTPDGHPFQPLSGPCSIEKVSSRMANRYTRIFDAG